MKHIIKNKEPHNFTEWKNSGIRKYSKLKNPLKKEVKNSLIEEQGGICCYCESSIINKDSHIEHFIPQSHLECNDLDYQNLFCSCQNQLKKGSPKHCGMSKDNSYEEELLISPLDKSCESKFEYDMNGNIYPINDDNSAIYTIDCLKLNLLKRKRKAVIDGIFETLATFDFDSYLKKDKNGYFNEFHTMIESLFENNFKSMR